MSSNVAHGPTIRSRTLLFLSYRDSAARTSTSYGNGNGNGNGYGGGYAGKGKGRGGEDSVRLLGGEDERDRTVVEMDMLPPRWVDISDRVEEITERVKPKIAHLDKLHAKHMLPGFTDRTAQEREIEDLTTDITRDFRTCQKHIRQIADLAKVMATSGDHSRRDLVMASNVQTALATKVQEISSTFRKKQSVYLKQIKGLEVRNQDLLAASGALPLKDSYAALNDDVELSNRELQSQSLLLREEESSSRQATTNLLSQRDREITGIAQSISELADLFKDLSNMVIDQGTMLDRIDYNIEKVSEEMREAVKELDVATHYQRRTGKCRLIFLLLLLIFGAIIILIYKPRNQSISDPAPPPLPPQTSQLHPPPQPVRQEQSQEEQQEPPKFREGHRVPEDDRVASGPDIGRFVGGGRGVALRFGQDDPDRWEIHW